MTSAIYPKAKEAFLKADIDLENDTIRAVLIDTGTYTYNSAHDFYNDLSGVVGTESGTFASKTFTNGVFDADNITFTAVTGNTVEAIVIFKDTGNTATDALICYIDGRAQVEVAVNASNGATTLVIENLPSPIASGATLTKISGTGPSTITTTSSAIAGARSLAVSALSTGADAGAVYEYPDSGVALPATPNGGDIVISWNASGIFAL